ncbi:MAG: hypothetical protein H0T68_02340 [Gemmatimonadales bacterium]|nr:hypothetical protein [Gemmatimonadales bacterium]
MYQPLEAVGPAAGRVVAFARGSGSSMLIAAVPRLTGAAGDPDLWSGTTLPVPADAPRQWTCALTGESHLTGEDGRLRLDRLFGVLPAALLLSDPDLE